MDSRTFCIIPWTQVRIDPNGRLFPCCKISPEFERTNINDLENFDQWWNGQALRDLRKNLHHGVAVDLCHRCWNDEAAGKSSLRQEYNKRLSKHADLKRIYHSQDFVAPGLPKSFDLNLSNICNFKCVMCTPRFSSRINAEIHQHASQFTQLGIRSLQDNIDYTWPEKAMFQKLLSEAIPNMRVLELKGGEPLLISNLKELIKKVEHKHLGVISITTNGSVPFDQDFIDELEKFQHIWISVSVDGVHHHGEYIRYGSSWSQTDQTIKQIQKLDNCTFKLNTVLHFYSTATFPGIADYALTNNLDLDILMCYHPDFLHINAMLPVHHARLLQWCQQRLTQHPGCSWLQDTVNFLLTYQFDPKAHQQCRAYTDTLDSVRQNALADIQALFHE